MLQLANTDLFNPLFPSEFCLPSSESTISLHKEAK